MKAPDFLDELAELALGSRLKRLSDRLLTDANQIYKVCGYDVQPKWFALLALLDKKQQVSIVEASDLLGLTQPAISQFVKELLAIDLIIIQPSKTDSRRKFMSLSQQGNLLVMNMQPMWRAVEAAASQICDEAGNDFFESIKSFEKAFGQQSLLQRTVAILENQEINPEVELLSYQPELAEHFKTINSEWIINMFELEDSDRDILNSPEELVINQGGKIYFASLPDLGVVGACALLKKDESSFELTKMGVLQKARGKKIGETLLNHVIEQANQMKIENLYLLTNKKCEAAIHLYLKFGFRHDAETMQRYGAKYERCNVAMRYFNVRR